MYLQGNLQAVFDILYDLGVIDPVLEMDWGSAMAQIGKSTAEFHRALQIVNKCQQDPGHLSQELKKIDPTILGYLAMEVAREYANYHSREILH